MNPPSARSSLSARLVLFFERYMPDPFVLAVGLTALVALAAVCLGPQGPPAVLVKSWYDGVFAIFGFAFQIIMILVTGHALAHAAPVRRGLERLVSLAKT